jgi:hypothetical protein
MRQTKTKRSKKLKSKSHKQDKLNLKAQTWKSKIKASLSTPLTLFLLLYCLWQQKQRDVSSVCSSKSKGMCGAGFRLFVCSRWMGGRIVAVPPLPSLAPFI